MDYISGFSKKKDDKWKTLVVISLFVVFLLGKAILESGHLLLCVVCLVLGILLYFSIESIQKKMVKKPASLGKIYEKKYPIIIQYTPPKGINPAEAGLLYNCSVEPTDLTSLIYQWKFEKLIDIKTFKGDNSKKEYIKLIKLEDMPLTRPLFESEIFDSIFSMGNIKIIEGAFQLRYALMLEDLEFYGIQKGWIYRERHNIKVNNMFKKIKFGDATFLGISYVFSLIIAMILDHVETSMDFSSLVWFIIILFGVVLGAIAIYGNIDGGGSLKFTDKGAELASKVIGYSQFIKSCDENKIKLLLKEDPLFIDRTLPYATAFGMETEFLNKISPLKKDWNARYVRGNKVPVWAGILRFFVKDKDSLL